MRGRFLLPLAVTWALGAHLGAAVAGDPDGTGPCVASLAAVATAVCLVLTALTLRDRRLVGRAAILAASCLAATALHAAKPVPAWPELPDGVDPLAGKRVRVASVASGPAQIRGPGWQLVVEPVALGEAGRWHAGPGAIRLRGDGPAPPVLAGDEVVFTAKLHGIERFRDPGVADARLRAAMRGIRYRAQVSDARALHVVPAARGPVAWLQGLRALALERSERTLRGPEGALCRALALGSEGELSSEVRAAFDETGTTHILSVSGAHLGFLALVLRALLLRLVRRAPGLLARAPDERWVALPLLAIVWLYVGLTGAAAATIRSALLLSLGIVARVTLRPVDVVELVALAWLGFCVVDPRAPFDIGLSLSVLGVLGLVLGAMPERQGGGRGWLTTGLRASLGAHALTAPVVVATFGLLALASPLANLIVVPLFESALLPIALLHTLTAAVSTALASALEPAFVLPMRAGLATVDALASWAPVVDLRGPFGPFAVCASSALCVVALRIRRTAAAIGCVAAGLLVALAGPLLPCGPPEGEVEVDFFDVAHGDATLVRVGGGATLLVDAGGRVHDEGLMGRRVVLPALASLGVRRLDAVALSHPHPDHENGLGPVIERLPVGLWLGNGQRARSNEHRRLERALRLHAVPSADLLAGPRRFQSGPATLDVLWPQAAPGRTTLFDPAVDENDNSLVLSLEAFGARVLLAGDIERASEAAIVELGLLGPPRPTVLKVPHHGSRTSSTEPFLRALAPLGAVAGARRAGVLAFPKPDVEARYGRLGIPLFVTEGGMVRLRVNAAGMELRQGARRLWLPSALESRARGSPRRTHGVVAPVAFAPVAVGPPHPPARRLAGLSLGQCATSSGSVSDYLGSALGINDLRNEASGNYVRRRHNSDGLLEEPRAQPSLEHLTLLRVVAGVLADLHRDLGVVLPHGAGQELSAFLLHLAGLLVDHGLGDGPAHELASLRPARPGQRTAVMWPETVPKTRRGEASASPRCASPARVNYFLQPEGLQALMPVALPLASFNSTHLVPPMAAASVLAQSSSALQGGMQR